MKRLFPLIFAAAALMAAACEKTPQEEVRTPDMSGLTVDGKFPIVAWTGIDAKDTKAKFGPMKECGINVYLGWYNTDEEVLTALENAQEAGVKLIIRSNNLLSDPARTASLIKDHPALLCYHIQDEPEVSDFPMLADIVQKIQEADSKHPCYINLYPNWAWGSIDGYISKVTSFTSTVPVKFLSFDHYPIFEKDGVSSIRPEWYKNLEDIRRVARAKNLPFWAFALALSHRLGDILYPIPTTEELRLQMFSNLVYGAQGFQYFTYWGIYQNAPTQVYERVKTVNEELQTLSKYFIGASISDVWHTGTAIPYGTKALGKLPDGVTSLTTSEGGAVVSYFVKDGIRYLALVNKDYKKAMKLDIAFSRKVTKIDNKGYSSAAVSGETTIEPGNIVLYKLND